MMQKGIIRKVSFNLFFLFMILSSCVTRKGLPFSKEKISDLVNDYIDDFQQLYPSESLEIISVKIEKEENYFVYTITHPPKVVLLEDIRNGIDTANLISLQTSKDVPIKIYFNDQFFYSENTLDSLLLKKWNEPLIFNDDHNYEEIVFERAVPVFDPMLETKYIPARRIKMLHLWNGTIETKEYNLK